MISFEIQSFGIDGLKKADHAEPKPGPGEVLVEIKAVSLNYRDYLTVIGEYNPRYKLPLVPCCDSAGRVVAVGEGVSDWKTGDDVIGSFAPFWQSGIPTMKQLRRTVGGPETGTLSQLRVYPADGLVRMPEHLDYEEAATLPCAGLTAWSALVSQGALQAGQRVLLLGTGGVSIAALQIASISGAEIIITSSSDEKLERARALGAHHTINYKDKSNWSKEVRRITKMEGVEHVVEVGGAGTLEHSLKSVKLFGNVYMIGILAGRSDAIDLIPILMQNVRVQGVVVGSVSMLREYATALAHHKIKPVVDRVFSFEEVQEAFQYLEAGKHFGKVCIRID